MPSKLGDPIGTAFLLLQPLESHFQRVYLPCDSRPIAYNSPNRRGERAYKKKVIYGFRARFTKNTSTINLQKIDTILRAKSSKGSKPKNIGVLWCAR